MGDYNLQFLMWFVLWYISAILFDTMMSFLSHYIEVEPATVHEGKGDAFVNSAMFLSIEDEY